MWKYFLCSVPRHPKGHCFVKFPTLHTVVLVRVALRWTWVWSIGGKILTGENLSARRKPCPSATLFTANVTQIGLCTDRPANNGLSHGTPFFFFFFRRLKVISVARTFRISVPTSQGTKSICNRNISRLMLCMMRIVRNRNTVEPPHPRIRYPRFTARKY
jgi:hypothetical protein